jgi:uncharacterized delta-60 repeat protein
MWLTKFFRSKLSGTIFGILTAVCGFALLQTQGGTVEELLDPEFTSPIFTPWILRGSTSIGNVVFSSTGAIFVTGSFTEVNGFATTNIVTLKPDWSVNTSFVPDIAANHVPGPLAVHPDGRVVAGGRCFLYRFLPNGKRDTTFQAVEAGGVFDCFFQVEFIRSLADDKIFLAGDFRAAGWTPVVQAPGIARLNPDGKLDKTFRSDLEAGYDSPKGHGAGRVLLVQEDGSILIIYTATSYQSPPSLARLTPDLKLDPTFEGASELINNTSYLVQVVNGVGGKFYASRLTSGNTAIITRFQHDGHVDTTFRPVEVERSDLPWLVTIAVQPDGRLLVGGRISKVNGVSRKGFARLFDDGSLDTYGADGVDGTISAFSFQPDGKILIIGNFPDPAGSGAERNILRLLPDAKVDPPVINSFPTNQTVALGKEVTFSVAAANGERMRFQWWFNGRKLSGETNATLTITNTVLRNIGSYHVQVSNSAGSALTPHATLTVEYRLVDPRDRSFDVLQGRAEPEFGRINDMLVQPDGKIILACQASVQGGKAARALVRLHPDGSRDETFRSGVGPDRGVAALALYDDGRVLIGGSFSTYDGVPRNSVARLRPDGTLDPSFDMGLGLGYYSQGEVQYGTEFSGIALTLAIQGDGHVLVGGNFNRVSGTTIVGIARLKGDGTLDGGPQVGLDGGLVDIIKTLKDGSTIAGGGFAKVDGVAVAAPLVKFDPNGKLDLEFGKYSILRGAVTGLALLDDGRMYVAGANLIHVARLNPDGNLDPTFQLPNWFPGPIPGLSSGKVIAQSDGKVVLVSNSTVAGPIYNMARFETDGTPELEAFSSLGFGPSLFPSLVTGDPDGRLLVAGEAWVGGEAGVYPRRVPFLWRLFSQFPFQLLEPAFDQTGFSAFAPGNRGVSYSFEYSESLSPGSWKQLETFIGENKARLLTDTNSAAVTRFYRLRGK